MISGKTHVVIISNRSKRDMQDGLPKGDDCVMEENSSFEVTNFPLDVCDGQDLIHRAGQ